jgi:uncharacterized membrane protein
VFTTYLAFAMIGSWLAGSLRSSLTFAEHGTAAKSYSYELAFWCVGFAMLCPLLLLLLARKEQVDRARSADRAVEDGWSEAVTAD